MSDIAIAVREGTDAVMLSGETAYGKFCFKAVDVMSTVAHRTESAMLRFSVRPLSLPDPNTCLRTCALIVIAKKVMHRSNGGLSFELNLR